MKKEKFFLMVIILAIFDQIGKLIVIINKSKLPLIIINGVFEIVYCENNGVAFGIGKGRIYLISIITTIILAMIIVTIYKNYSKINKKLLWGSVLLLAGGIGNLLDRVFRLCVIDFFYFSIIDFPVFNLADAYIVLGIITIIAVYIKMLEGKY